MGVSLNDAFIVLFGYLLGSVNFAIIISKASGNGDVRDYGSGNAGTSNVARTIGLKYGAVVMVLDILKGFIAAMVGKHFVPADGIRYRRGPGRLPDGFCVVGKNMEVV